MDERARMPRTDAEAFDQEIARLRAENALHVDLHRDLRAQLQTENDRVIQAEASWRSLDAGISERVQAAVAAERERCAKIAEEWEPSEEFSAVRGWEHEKTRQGIAEALRAAGEGGGAVSEATPSITWREYRVQVPAGMASIIDKALDEQVALENRAIDFSEFACWLLGMGLAARAQLVKEHKKAERRIIEP